MGKYAKVNLDSLRPAGATPQGRCESSFESRNRTFDLHPLAILDFWKTAVHLTSVFCLGPASPASLVEVNDRAADAENLAGEHMVVFGIIAGIRQKPVDNNSLAGALQDRAEQRGVVARPVADNRVDQEMCRAVAGQRQFGPATKRVAFLPGSVGIVRRSVPRLHACGIDARFLFYTDNRLLPGVVENRIEQPVEQTFFRRRCCAL